MVKVGVEDGIVGAKDEMGSLIGEEYEAVDDIVGIKDEVG